jgi:Flp pilus assembly protein CpaB
MSARSILLIAAALLMAAGTFLVMKSWLANQRSKPVVQVVEAQVETQVLVARADLPLGTFVNDQHGNPGPTTISPRTTWSRANSSRKTSTGRSCAGVCRRARRS